MFEDYGRPNKSVSFADKFFSSPTTCVIVLVGASALAAVTAWNWGVDCYVAHYGVQVQAPVVTKYRHGGGFRRRIAIFRFYGAELPDKYHLLHRFEPFCGQHGDQSAAIVYGSYRNYFGGGYGHMTVCYLPDSPGTFVAKEDIGRFLLQPIALLLMIVGIFYVGHRLQDCLPESTVSTSDQFA